ncbi:hypothetical protein BC830DRAFT_1227420 [Chytriomyces sp. MP71]|nr:hypothetical protein BC830DRAFT_1227420 [Chytriomyces sp. MP71]
MRWRPLLIPSIWCGGRGCVRFREWGGLFGEYGDEKAVMDEAALGSVMDIRMSYPWMTMKTSRTIAGGTATRSKKSSRYAEDESHGGLPSAAEIEFSNE